MLFKLALSGLKSRFKDYLVLFSGLIVTSAIFYMFLSLSTNPEFLNQNTTISIIGVVFIIGDILLALITLVYIIYANSFLLSMRQRDYGLFMMLGAKSSKIGNLIFVETLFLGILATVVGLVIGVFATQGVANLLISNLSLSINGFIGFHMPAILWTMAFFFVLFLSAALFNRIKLSAIPILSLLKSNEKPVKYRRNPVLIFAQFILGTIALIVGYYAMNNIMTLKTDGFWLALIGVVVGTFLLFKSIFGVIIDILRQSNRVKYRNLNNFTINQIKFRLTEYTRILTVVSILFAMAVGAITVALSMRTMAFEGAENLAYYDTAVYSEKEGVKEAVAKLPIEDETTFHYKVEGSTIYALSDELNTLPIKMKTPDKKVTSYSGDSSKNSVNDLITSAYNNLHPKNELFASSKDVNYQYVNRSTFNTIPVTQHSVQLIKTVGGIRENLSSLNALNQLQNATPSLDVMTQAQVGGQVINYYQLFNSTYSGFQFMGIFLGVAFLTMLASILIFKILSGAHQDKKRYEMLDKIGTRRSVMTRSIAKELAVLFVLPALVGLTHMLFGLKLFQVTMIPQIYGTVVVPVTIFLTLYFLYYLLTFFIYRSIVLRKRK